VKQLQQLKSKSSGVECTTLVNNTSGTTRVRDMIGVEFKLDLIRGIEDASLNLSTSLSTKLNVTSDIAIAM
jgi:hypothetical protein